MGLNDYVKGRKVGYIPGYSEVNANPEISLDKVLSQVNGGDEVSDDNSEQTMSNTDSACVAKEKSSFQTNTNSPFTFSNIGNITLPSLPFDVDIKHVSFVGDISYLLNFINDTEARLKLTLPLSAYGLDRRIFDNMKTINIENRTYEIVAIDDVAYLSCTSHILDAEFFNDVIKEATLSMVETKRYSFPLIGPRLFRDSDGEMKVFTTMRLCTYELNCLIAFLSKFNSVSMSILPAPGEGGCILTFKQGE